MEKFQIDDSLKVNKTQRRMYYYRSSTVNVPSFISRTLAPQHQEGGNLQNPHRVKFGQNGSFWSPNGIAPVGLCLLLLISIIISMALPWVSITEYHVLPTGEHCGFKELRGWSRMYCQYINKEPACLDYYSGQTPQITVPREFTYRLTSSSMTSCEGFDWREVDSDMGYDSTEMRTIYTLPAVFVSLSLVCCVALLMVFVVRCISETARDRHLWHTVVAVFGLAFLMFALMLFAVSHPSAYSSYVNTKSTGRDKCEVGPCYSFKGNVELPNFGMVWGPAGWTVSCIGLLGYALVIWYTTKEYIEDRSKYDLDGL